MSPPPDTSETPAPDPSANSRSEITDAPTRTGNEDEHELTIVYQKGLDQGMDRTMSISGLLEKHSLDTPVNLGATGDADGESLLPSRHLKGGRYEVIELIAKGGMGVVLRSMDRDLRRKVAMKVIAPQKGQHSESMIRFIEEAQITGQLEHPNIVPVHELGVDGNENLFYTMKLIRGLNLKEVLDGIRAGRKDVIERFTLPRLLNIYLKVCDAVAFAHSKGVIHRDLKPHNIMIGDFGEVLVLDWGIAKILPPDYEEDREYGRWDGDNQTRRAMSKVLAQRRGSHRPKEESMEERLARVVDSIRMDEDSDTARTRDGLIMGSPGFMAPEQAFGDNSEIDRRTDIYSLGAILFNILSLRQHVEGKDVQQILKRMVSDKRESPIETVRRRIKEGKEIKLPHCPAGRIPHALSHVSVKALQTWKRDRYQKVEDLQDDILAYLGGYATAAEAVSPIRKCLLLVRRNKIASIAVVAALAMTVIATYLIVRETAALKKDLASAESRVDELSVERDILLRDLNGIEASGFRARVAAENLAQYIEGWHWEKADQERSSFLENEELSALLLPPRQLMSLAQLQLFHGEIDKSLALLQLLNGSSLSEASQALIGELTTDEEEPISLSDTSTEIIELYTKLRSLEHAETRLAADCLMAGAVQVFVQADRGEEAFALATELMRHNSRHPESLKITRGDDEGSSVTIAQAQPGPIRLEALRMLPVENLDISGCPGIDVSALREMTQLKTLRVAKTVKGLDELRDLKLDQIGFDDLLPAEEFWRQQAQED